MIIGIVVAVFVALNVLDIILTNRILARGGRELNPLMAWAIDKLWQWWWAGKIGLCFLSITLMMACYLYGLIIFTYCIGAAVNAVYIYVVWSNFKVYRGGK